MTHLFENCSAEGIPVGTVSEEIGRFYIMGKGLVLTWGGNKQMSVYYYTSYYI